MGDYEETHWPGGEKGLPRTQREIDLLNERLYLRAAVYRMWVAMLDVDEQAMTLLAGRTDAWPLIDALERGQAAYRQLLEEYPDPYLDDDLMLRTCGCSLDVRATAPKGLSCSHPEHVEATHSGSYSPPQDSLDTDSHSL